VALPNVLDRVYRPKDGDIVMSDPEHDYAPSQDSGERDPADDSGTVWLPEGALDPTLPIDPRPGGLGARLAERRGWAYSPVGAAIPEGRIASAPGEATPLTLVPLPPDGDTQRYRLMGSVTFASMLALEQVVSQLPGITFVKISPAAEDGPLLALTSVDPQRTADEMRSLADFPLREA
jgi:hypothetical protein